MISVIGTVGVPACYGGFESLVENLLPSEDIGVIYCSKGAYKSRLFSYKGSRLKFIPLDANGAQSIPYDIVSILHSIFFTKNDLLILGVSGAICLPFIRLFSSRKIVTNIDGLEWKRDKWSSSIKKFLKLSERLAVKYSDVVIADNKAIADYVKSEYLVESQVIAYGGDHALIASLDERDREGYALALCRIEPENNVHLILDAFSRKPSKFLKFIGNWNKSEYGRELKSYYSSYENIEIIDPIYDLNLLFEYRSKCSYYIHGHSAGGTNPSLVEMMFFKVPILCFDCSYNRASTEEQAVYFKSVDDLSDALSKMDSISSFCGEKMYEIASRRYTWSIVKQQYFSLF